VPQLAIEDEVGVFAHVDLGGPNHRIVMEFDGPLTCDGRDPQPLRSEKLRPERLEQPGWIVVRLTWQDVVHEPDRATARLRAAFAHAARR
jgi:very-short-patch-repair endonuclease